MTLAALVADLGHPRVRFSDHLTIEGAEGWRRVLDHCPPPTPPEARRLLELLLAHAGVNLDPLPSWVCPKLAATKAARTRLRAWAVAGSIAPTVDDVARKLQIVGDEEIAQIVRNALVDRIPPPVVDFVLREVSIYGVGWSAAGWSFRCAPPAGAIVNGILLSGASHDQDKVLDFALHEIAHSWLLEVPVSPMAMHEMLNQVAADQLVAARDPAAMERLLRPQDESESQADQLSWSWGGHTNCVARNREATIAAALRLDEAYGPDAVAASVAAANLPTTDPSKAPR